MCDFYVVVSILTLLEEGTGARWDVLAGGVAGRATPYLWVPVSPWGTGATRQGRTVRRECWENRKEA